MNLQLIESDVYGHLSCEFKNEAINIPDSQKESSWYHWSKYLVHQDLDQIVPIPRNLQSVGSLHQFEIRLHRNVWIVEDVADHKYENLLRNRLLPEL